MIFADFYNVDAIWEALVVLEFSNFLLFPMILLRHLLFQRFFHALSVLAQRAILIVLLAFLFCLLHVHIRPNTENEWIGIVNISDIKRWNIDIGFLPSSLGVVWRIKEGFKSGILFTISTHDFSKTGYLYQQKSW